MASSLLFAKRDPSLSEEPLVSAPRELEKGIEEAKLVDSEKNGPAKRPKSTLRFWAFTLKQFVVKALAVTMCALLLLIVLSLMLSLVHMLAMRFWQNSLQIKVPSHSLSPTSPWRCWPQHRTQHRQQTNELTESLRQFQQFERDFKRVWKSDSERWERFEIFIENLHQIELLNLLASVRGKNVTYGVNAMSDQSEEELRQMLLPLDAYEKLHREAKFIRKMSSGLRRKIKAAANSYGRYPGHFDWREKGVVTPVKAQGQCGSCWAFASVATTESAYAIAHGDLRSLSEQELLDCNLENFACKGGSVDRAFSFIHDTGLVSEWEYPYVAERQPGCKMDQRSENLTKIETAVFLNPDEGSIIDWLINFGPVNVGIAVPPDMKPYRSGIYHPSDYDCKFRVVGLHSLLIVGYGTSENGQKYWIVKNSWGNTWGQEHGYVNFIRGVNSCGIEDEPIGLLA